MSGRQHCVQQKLPSFFLRMHFDPFSGARFRCSATQSHRYACRLVVGGGGGGAETKSAQSACAAPRIWRGRLSPTRACPIYRIQVQKLRTPLSSAGGWQRCARPCKRMVENQASALCERRGSGASRRVCTARRMQPNPPHRSCARPPRRSRACPRTVHEIGESGFGAAEKDKINVLTNTPQCGTN